MNLKHGVFLISLDFELYWGLRDKRSIDQYEYNLHGVRKVVPKLLKIFSENDIHATWATVGFLFFKNSDDLKENIPDLLPTYNRKELSPYTYISENSNLETKYHFAKELIMSHDGQEIGTHTFSHYYCLEEGQSLLQFKEDIFSAIQAGKNMGVHIKGLVFPRNQWNPEYLDSLAKLGVQCFRGNESNWIYKASDDENQNIFRRTLRLVDSYINLSGHKTYYLKDCIQYEPFNFPASQFLRPYSKKLAILDKLKLKRIKSSMEDAAINNRIFHLWWHPHNFGINTDKNMDFLKEIAAHYCLLRKKHGLMSLNMGELCQLSGAGDGE